MDLQQRIDLLNNLSTYIKSDSAEWIDIKESATRENPWFILPFIHTAVENIVTHFLQKEKLFSWVKQYDIENKIKMPKTIGLVMAGNIPLVGFHDFLCAFISGHYSKIKTSSKDAVLITHLIEKIYEWEPSLKKQIQFADNLKGCDAYIATGSNNSSRYFDYYFGKYPNIIRKNRTSVAILNGTETLQDLDNLAGDIQLYFGLGCRNVTKIYVPQQYDFLPLLDSLKKYDYYLDYHKYKHNYDYHLALLIMGNKYYMTNGSIVLCENESFFSPVSQIHYSFYSDYNKVISELQHNENIQCIVGKNFTAFGAAQKPTLNDYADGIDTMKFLTDLQ